VTRILFAAALLAALTARPARADETIGTPCTNVRSSPGITAPAAACLPPGTSVQPDGLTTQADGYTWVRSTSGWIAAPYLSGTPDEDPLSTIAATGGEYAPCLAKIFLREDPGGGVHQPNLGGSPANGWFQFYPSTFANTPTGHTIDIWHASGAQQVEAARWMLATGQGSAWSPLPAGC